MSDLHVLVDFENVQPTFEQVAKLAPGFAELWLFHGPHQLKLAQRFRAAHDGVTPVPISRTGNNALDFHLAFYLGYVAAKNPQGRLVVIANDTGYDPMIVHAKTLGFTARRIGFKRPAAAKKRPPAKKAAPIKVTPAAKEPAALKAAVAAKDAAPAATTQFKRITMGLTRMGDKRPTRLRSFLRHVECMLGKGTTLASVQETVRKLESAGVIQILGDQVMHTATPVPLSKNQKVVAASRCNTKPGSG